MLRSTAIKIVKHLGVVGECNVQYALCPTSLEYAVIEVNARLSRSSALASKATGYPLAFVAAKLSLGSSLPDLKNAVTKTTTANFEPSMDYVVTKIPRWDLRKFQHVARGIGSSMKSVGEVMAVGRSWEESLQKAIRMVDPGSKGFEGTLYEPSDLDEALRSPTDNRLAIIGHAMIDKAYSVDTIHSLTKIDKWFLYKLENIVKMRREVSACVSPTISIPASVLARAKKLGFSDFQIAELVGTSEVVVRNHRKALGIIPYVKRIDTLASEFPAATNYLYTTYNASTHDVDFEERGVLVLGSGVYRIGSSVEFDWCGVSCIRSLRQLGHRTIMINYNPETVSTDFDECDRLYFEELSLERTLDIYELENASGCIVSVGGQLPQNIAMSLQAQGVHVFGTNPVMLDRCEDREKFSSVMDNIGVDQPAWKTLTSKDDALVFALEVGYVCLFDQLLILSELNSLRYPVLVRPSYVLSGAAMNVAYTANELSRFLQMAIAVSPHHPIVVTKFIQNAQELDVDAVASNGDLVVYSLAQHIENAGVHSGDATLILPPLMPGDAPIGHERWGLQPISFSIVDDVREITRKVAKAFQITGPFNMQLILERGNRGHSLKMIECNLRASRSFPFSSKVLGVNFIDLATRALVGHPSLEVEKPSGDLMLLRRPYKAVKVPVFSWTRLAGADPSLGVEMASTGEVACFGRDAKEAFLLAHMSNHNNFEELPMGAGSSVVFTMDELTNLEEAAYVAGKLHGLDYRLLVDVKENQERLLSACDDSSLTLGLLVPSAPDAASLVKVLQDRRLSKEIFGGVSLVLSFCQIRPLVQVDVGYLVRRSAVDFGIGLLNEPKSAMVLADALVDYLTGAKTKAESVRDWGSWINV